MSAAIVSVPLILVLALITAGHFLAIAQTSHSQPSCGDYEMQEQTRAAMFVALDDAFRQRIAATYSVWMSDNRGQPARAKAGVDQAVAGYLHGYNAIQMWRLPPCGREKQ